MISLIGAVSFLTACATNAAPNQPAVTSTVTASVTVTATPSSTTSSTPKSTPTTPGTSIPASTVPAPSIAEANNNPHFFFNKELLGYSTPVVLSGTPTPTPAYRDIYLDLDLGKYITGKDAYFDPRIPGITDHDDWLYIFELPLYKLPWVINWSYTTKPNSPNTTFTFNVYKKDDFLNLYNKSPNLLLDTRLGSDRGTSDNSIHAIAVNETGSFVMMMRTNNADGIASWWVKYGGQKFGQ